MYVWVVEGMEATSSDILGVYSTEEEAEKIKDIMEYNYCSVEVHKRKLNEHIKLSKSIIHFRKRGNRDV